MLIFQKKTGVGTGTPFDITNASYVTSYDLDNMQIPNTRGVVFSPDGTKLFGFSLGGGIKVANLSTPWDVSTTVIDTPNTVNLSVVSVRNMTINSSGTRIYLADNGNLMKQWDLSTAWDLTSTPGAPTATFTLGDTNVNGVAWKPDGSQMLYVGNTANAAINGYSFTVPWEIGAKSTVSGTFGTSPETTPMSISFSTDGTRMFISGSQTKAIRQYTLGTAWDVTTASFDVSFSVAAQMDDPWDVVWKSDGKQFWVSNNSGGILYLYNTN